MNANDKVGMSQSQVEAARCMDVYLALLRTDFIVGLIGQSDIRLTTLHDLVRKAVASAIAHGLAEDLVTLCCSPADPDAIKLTPPASAKGPTDFMMEI